MQRSGRLSEGSRDVLNSAEAIHGNSAGGHTRLLYHSDTVDQTAQQ